MTSRKIVISETVSYDAAPLNFSFKKIKDLNGIELIQDLKLPTMKPSTGVKKHVPFIEAEESKKEIEKIVTEEEQKESKMEGEELQNAEEDQQSPEKGTEEKEKTEKKEVKEKKEPEIIRVIPTYNVSNFIAENNKPLNATSTVKGQSSAAMNKNTEELKNLLNQKVVKVKRICSSIVLSYNQIRSIVNFFPIVDSIMDGCKNLASIDLSHNYLVNLDYVDSVNQDFADFPNLYSLSLHCNYIKDMKEILKLSNNPLLRSITIHGNPIENIPSFRLYIIAYLPKVKKIDTVLVSKKERDNASVLIYQFRNLNLPVVNDAQSPPEEGTVVVADNNN